MPNNYFESFEKTISRAQKFQIKFCCFVNVLGKGQCWTSWNFMEQIWTTHGNPCQHSSMDSGHSFKRNINFGKKHVCGAWIFFDGVSRVDIIAFVTYEDEFTLLVGLRQWTIKSPPEGRVLPFLADCGRGGIRTPDIVVRSYIL